MSVKPGIQNFFRMLAGAVVMLAVVILVITFLSLR